jgi:hypothetical protein
MRLFKVHDKETEHELVDYVELEHIRFEIGLTEIIGLEH